MVVCLILALHFLKMQHVSEYNSRFVGKIATANHESWYNRES